jgi:hypothetical protein
VAGHNPSYYMSPSQLFFIFFPGRTCSVNIAASMQATAVVDSCLHCM